MNKVKTKDGRERFGICNVICLGEAMSNQTSFVKCTDTIRMIFEDGDILR